jgi:hypothetical protein
MTTYPMVRKRQVYFSRCVICQAGCYVYIIERHHEEDVTYPGVYNRSLLCKDSKGSVSLAFVCEKEECFNMALLNPNFYWN